jgi:hypothetical protein
LWLRVVIFAVFGRGVMSEASIGAAKSSRPLLTLGEKHPRVGKGHFSLLN